MKNILRLLICLISASFIITSCQKEEAIINIVHYTDQEFETLSKSLDLPRNPHDYSLKLPEALFREHGALHIPGQNDLATLGRVFFYDKNLSATREVSCASCHLPEFGFSDDKAFSEGFKGDLTTRNSLALATTISFSTSYNNGAEQAFFLWDERAHNISEQSKLALFSPEEMGMTEHLLNQRVAAEEYYDILLRKAFPSIVFNQQVESWMVFSALEEFVNSISATKTKFDEGIAASPGFDPNPDFSNFTEEENLGKTLFIENCSSCHGDKFNVTVKAIGNNGLDLEYADQGIGVLQGEIFNGVFKIPTLRNIALTGPYMHDGRFDTLEEVVEHYNSGVAKHKNLSSELKDPQGEPIKLNFNTDEKKALVAFLETLTDNEVISDPKFLDPFK